MQAGKDDVIAVMATGCKKKIVQGWRKFITESIYHADQPMAMDEGEETLGQARGRH